jgi:hypothetical protein
MWFVMAEWIKRGGCLPRMPELVRELTAPTYSFQNGKFLLEPKEQIKRRLGFSPDIADSLAMTFFMPDMPATGPYDHMIKEKQNRHVADYDPYAPERE